MTWPFALQRIYETSTRLISRSSGTYTRVWAGRYLSFFVHPIHFGMQRKQLLNIKYRAETDTMKVLLTQESP